MHLIRLADVMQKTSLRRSTIYKYIAVNAFPRPVPIGGGRVAWVDAEIDDWVVEKIKARDAS
ncbi:AlpA family transcriptional regulator [Jeongeupia sp. USM3]|uniref:AlpA family transcriptional regulator n=1 Tax=Jeongeupia sp. USM3 TaxID=1906741 RepID=UPI00089DEA4A|nr:AlpA family transcriptional regulator [Jeongeupia sp. USM3]AOX99254.1 transcriptional regulator [Jeongeupia sp. USM3]